MKEIIFLLIYATFYSFLDVVTMGLSQNKSLLGFIAHLNSYIPLNYVHMMSDMRSTGSSMGKTNNTFYSLDLMTRMLGADIVITFFSDTCNILNSVLKQKNLAWQGYEDRFCMKIRNCSNGMWSSENFILIPRPDTGYRRGSSSKKSLPFSKSQVIFKTKHMYMFRIQGEYQSTFIWLLWGKILLVIP